MSGRLQDKVAIVTGAGCIGPGWGNGRATAVRFAQEGARIFAVDRKPDSVDETVAARAGGRRRDRRAPMRRHQRRLGRGHGRGLRQALRPHRRAGEQCRRLGARRAGGDARKRSGTRQVDYNLKSVFLTLKHVLPVMEAAEARRHRQHGLELRPALDRRGAGRLRRDQGRRHPDVARGRGAICQQGHPREHGGPRPVAHADGGGAARRPARRRRRRGAARLTASSASRSASWATAATPPTPRCSSPPTRRASSPAPRSWSTAA